MSEVRFQTESTLIEQQKKQKTDNTQVGNSKPSGIDFKNDTVLVTARINFQDAQAVENSRLLDQTSASTELSHTESDISVLLGSYQNLVNQLSQAQSQSESLATHQQSVLDKLSAQNETVNNLSNNKTTSAGVINNLSVQLTSKSIAKSAAEGRRTTVTANIASFNEQISNLRGQITETTTPEEKADIEQQIAALESQKTAEENNLTNINNEIETIDKDITDLQKQKTVEEANFKAIEEQLGEAVMVLTGLTLEQASVAALLKESQTYETNLNIQLEQVEAKIAAKEAEKEDQQKNVDKATQKATAATTDAKEKEAVYHKEETAAEARAKENEDKNIFLA